METNLTTSRLLGCIIIKQLGGKGVPLFSSALVPCTRRVEKSDKEREHK